MKITTFSLLLSAMTLCAGSAMAITPFPLDEATASDVAAAPTVSPAPADITVSPAEGWAADLQKFDITFVKASTVEIHNINYGNAPTLHKTGSDAGKQFCFTYSTEGNVMHLSVSKVVTEEGDWTLTLPGGFYKVDGVVSTEIIEFNYKIGSPQYEEGQIIKVQPTGKRVDCMTRLLAWSVTNGNLFGTELSGKPMHYVVGNDGYLYIYNAIIKGAFNGNQMDSYIRGEKDGDEYVFKFPQPVYEETVDGATQTWYANKLKLVKYTDEEGNATGSDYIVAEDNTVRMKITEDGSLEAVTELSSDNIVGTMVNDKWNGFGNIRMTYDVMNYTLYTPPTDLETMDAEMSFDSHSSGHKTTYLKVGIVGNEVWIKGMGYNVLPDAWAHGTIGDGDVIALDPYIGISEQYGQYVFLWGADPSENSLQLYDATLTYNREAKTMTADLPIALNPNNWFWYAFEQYKNCVIKLLVEDDGLTSHEPKAPESVAFSATIENENKYLVTATLSNLNVDGQPMNEDKLTYQFILPSGETYVFHPWVYPLSNNATDIPYNCEEGKFTFISASGNQRTFTLKDQPGLENIGVRMVYTDVTGTNYSTITWAKAVSAIGEIAVDEAAAVEYYDLTGRPVVSPRSGCYIKVTTVGNARHATKVMR